MTTTIAKKQNGNPSANFGDAIDNIFQNSLRRFFDNDFFDADSWLTKGTVPVNVREMPQQYEIDVVAPGCRKEEFKIQVNDNLLIISLDHTDKSVDREKAGWVRNEYTYRSFSRSFALDDTVDVSKISATYTDGVLHLVLAKNEKAKKTCTSIEIK